MQSKGVDFQSTKHGSTFLRVHEQIKVMTLYIGMGLLVKVTVYSSTHAHICVSVQCSSASKENGHSVST